MSGGAFIVAHDVGTSGVKTVLTDGNGTVLAKHITEYPTHYPAPGRAEQAADDWWGAVCAGTRAVLPAAAGPGSVACVTHSTQMIGLVPMNSRGVVLRRPIIWLDSRAGREATAVMRRLGGRHVFSRLAGATLTGKDGIPKLRWLRDHEPEVWAGAACFVDVGGYLLFRCTGRSAMDWTEASVFGFDLRRKRWLTGIMRYAGIDPAKLPPLVPPNAVVGALSRSAAADLGLAQGTPVVSGMGDAPAASVGAGAVRLGDAHAYLGTSAWVGVLDAGHPTGRHGIAVLQSGDPEMNLVIGEMETGGECVRWMADELYRSEQTSSAHENVFATMDREAETVPPGAGSLLFTPWMYGERVPVSDPLLRAAFINLSAAHHRADLVRAVLEGVAYNFRWTLDRLDRDFHLAPRTLRLVGGGARSAVWMQILADVTGRPIEVVRAPQDAGAVGAALGAGVALGFHRSFSALRDLVSVDAQFTPRAAPQRIYNELFGAYQAAYRRLRGVYHGLNENTVDVGEAESGDAPRGDQVPADRPGAFTAR